MDNQYGDIREKMLKTAVHLPVWQIVLYIFGAIAILVGTVSAIVCYFWYSCITCRFVCCFVKCIQYIFSCCCHREKKKPKKKKKKKMKQQQEGEEEI